MRRSLESRGNEEFGNLSKCYGEGCRHLYIQNRWPHLVRCIYNLLQAIVNTCSPDLTILCLILLGCKTPQVTNQTEIHDRSEVIAEDHETNSIDDTMTIRHTIINDTAFETKIIRKVINQRETLAQTLQDDKHQAIEKKIDTLTPAITRLLIKGITVACIGIAVVVAGLFISLLLLIIRIKK